ncbi:hypothetical protein PM082_019352 [Marasmius tenuissimus]|nr:hypothetical protein PM082_019352 [Marasmius tenuissimus]
MPASPVFLFSSVKQHPHQQFSLVHTRSCSLDGVKIVCVVDCRRVEEAANAIQPLSMQLQRRQLPEKRGISRPRSVRYYKLLYRLGVHNRALIRSRGLDSSGRMAAVIWCDGLSAPQPLTYLSARRFLLIPTYFRCGLDYRTSKETRLGAHSTIHE